MTGDENVGIACTLCRGEHRVERADRPPIGEEMTLVVMRPWVIAEIVLVVDVQGEDKVRRRTFCRDPCIGEAGDGDLAFLELRTERAKESSCLG